MGGLPPKAGRSPVIFIRCMIPAEQVYESFKVLELNFNISAQLMGNYSNWESVPVCVNREGAGGGGRGSCEQSNIFSREFSNHPIKSPNWNVARTNKFVKYQEESKLLGTAIPAPPPQSRKKNPG